jgi:hypothetical protein
MMPTKPPQYGAEMPDRRVKSGFMHYDNTITLGNVVTVGMAVAAAGIAWGAMSARQDAADLRDAQQGQQFSQAISRIDEALKEQRLEMKDQARALSAITTDTALIRGRLAGNDGTSTGRK